MDLAALPSFDLGAYLQDPTSETVREQCLQMGEFMHQTGILIVKDPRVSAQDNNVFLDMLERYFGQSAETKVKDSRPELLYQVGTTPEFIEVPRCAQEPQCLEMIEKMPEEDKAHLPKGPDPKERFFWRMGERPPQTDFPSLNAPPVIPEGMPEWEDRMNSWGSKLLTAVSTVAEMVALGFGLDRNAFTSRMQYAPHLLAPTATDMEKFGGLDTIVAGFHYDLSFLTIHGKSRYPGLYVWLRNNKKVLVSVPDGCLLIQAGKQMEILTGGHVMAGYHEVVVVPKTIEVFERAKNQGHSTWRISSTLFSHIASDEMLEPLAHFGRDPEVKAKYPPIKTGDQVEAELRFIKLSKQ